MTLFEIIHYFIDNQKKHNPFDVALAEFFHDDCRARLVIEILNKIGLYISYDECQRIDFGLMKQVIKASGSNRVSISLSINKKILIHEAMDNFNHNEATSSEIGHSHDILQRLFARNLQPHHKTRNHRTKFFLFRNL